MRVRVLGGLTVDGIAERDLGSRKARTLLKALVLGRGAAVGVGRLADILWGDDPPARPVDQLGVLVSRLRAVVGADRLTRSDAGYSLAVDWLDVDELETRTREAAEALAHGRVGAARAAAHAALALARGPVLPEEDGEWVDVARAAADATAATARRVAAEAAGRAGDHLAAVAAAEDALAHDPYDEAALRALMRAHVAAGRPASALAAYVRVRDRLVEDLGVSPTAETEALHDAIVVADGAVAPAATRGASLAGREPELTALDGALQLAAASSRPVVVAVVGEPGIGKSTLLDHWRRALAVPALTLVGRCDPLGRDLPLQPVVDAVVAHLAGLDEDSRARALGADAPVLGPLLGVEHGAATVVADADLGRARLFAALHAVVGRLADQRVVVLVVDDLHLAGESTLSWLRFAARRPGRLLVVTASRTPASGADRARTSDAIGRRTIQLGPLDVDAAAVIVGDDRAAALHERSGGHPLLLTALAAAEDEELPASVHDAVARRVDALGDAASTIRAAAVLGTDIDLDLLADVLRAPVVDLLEHLEEATAAGLLVERGAGFAFRHELERETIELAAGAARRALIHRDAARAMATRDGPDPLVVAVHARLGGDVDLAVDWFTRAADVAMARFDVEAAQAHLDAALALGDAPAAYARRARLRMATELLDDAAADAARAVAGGAGADGLEVSGWVAYYRRRYDEALGFADAAIERADDDGLRVSSLALAGRVRHASGHVVDGVANLEQAVATDAPAPVRALAAVWLAQTRVHQGRPGDALTLLDRALTDPERIAHPFAPLHGWFTRVLALGQLGRAADALRACDELDAEVVRRGEVGGRMVAPATNVRGWILRWSGRPDEADDLNRAAIAASDADGVRAEAYYAGQLDLVDGRLLAGDDAGASALLDGIAGIRDWNGTMAWHQRHRWHLLHARLALNDGDLETARARCAEVAGDAASRGARRYEVLARALGMVAGDDDRDLDAVVAALRTCAALDGVPLIEELTARRR